MSQRNETFIFLAYREHKHEKNFILIGYIPSSLDCFSITKKLQRVFSSTLHFAWQFSCKWNRRSAILPQTNLNKLIYLFTSIRDSNNSRGCEKILEIPEGSGGGTFWRSILENPAGRRGHMVDPFRWGGWYGYFLEPLDFAWVIA